jgi:cell wall-associated NlpC family hydrolase
MSRATLRARKGVTAASLIIGFGLAAASPAAAASTTVPRFTPAHAQLQVVSQTRSMPSRRARLTREHNAKVRRVLREARRQKGKPYVYGDAGPGGFDCSGLVRFVFMHAVHRVLPHNAAQQFHSLRHISRRSLQPGDLIFTDNGYISHVGIYAGHHHWWVAPHTGTRVQLQRIYHAHFVYARVLVYHKH